MSTGTPGNGVYNGIIIGDTAHSNGDDDTRMIFDSSTDKLYYDPDGSAAAIQFAFMLAGTVTCASAFTIVSNGPLAT